MTFLEWLDDEHHRVATEYRIELYKEIQHCKRIFGKITPDAKDMLCLLYTSPSPRDRQKSRMPSSA